jgi:hypothetical protein
MCPKGNDPLTSESADGVTEKYEVQTVIVGDGIDDQQTEGFWTLTFTDSYGNEWTTRPIRSADPEAVPLTTGNANSDVGTSQDVTSLEVRAALMEIPNHVFDDVEVNWEAIQEKGNKNSDGTASTGDLYYNKYTITFISPATSGQQSLLKCNYKGCDYDGCQPRFTGIGTYGTTSANSYRKCSVRGYIEDSNNHIGTGENAECSNRGLCNTEDGLCECFEGYTGESCSVQTILV